MCKYSYIEIEISLLQQMFHALFVTLDIINQDIREGINRREICLARKLTMRPLSLFLDYEVLLVAYNIESFYMVKDSVKTKDT